MALVTLQFVKNEEKMAKSSGNPYIACSIKVAGKYYNGFGSEETLKWKAGQQVEVDLYQEEYNGKMYGKFSILPPNPLEERIANLEIAMNKTINFLKMKFPELSGGQPSKPVTTEQVKEVFGEGTEEIKKQEKVPDDLPWD